MLVGKKAGRNIAKGGFITITDIQTVDSSSIDIPNDTRAITIPVDKFKGIASHIQAGSRVDILKVANPPEFIAQNIKIVSFEAKVADVTRTSIVQKVDSVNLRATQASAITFLVPIDLVSKLIDAMFEGDLQIITRNNGDDKIFMTEMDLPPPPETNNPVMPTITQPEIVETPEPTMPDPDPKKIEFIKASSVSTIEFDPDELQVSSSSEENSLSDKKLKELLNMVN